MDDIVNLTKKRLNHLKLTSTTNSPLFTTSSCSPSYPSPIISSTNISPSLSPSLQPFSSSPLHPHSYLDQSPYYCNSTFCGFVKEIEELNTNDLVRNTTFSNGSLHLNKMSTNPPSPYLMVSLIDNVTKSNIIINGKIAVVIIQRRDLFNLLLKQYNKQNTDKEFEETLFKKAGERKNLDKSKEAVSRSLYNYLRPSERDRLSWLKQADVDNIFKEVETRDAFSPEVIYKPPKDLFVAVRIPTYIPSTNPPPSWSQPFSFPPYSEVPFAVPTEIIGWFFEGYFILFFLFFCIFLFVFVPIFFFIIICMKGSLSTLPGMIRTLLLQNNVDFSSFGPRMLKELPPEEEQFDPVSEWKIFVRSLPSSPSFSYFSSSSAFPSLSYFPSLETCQNRRLFYSSRVLTIDPITACDLDDAISITKIEENEYEMGVHISDVTFYVGVNSLADRVGQIRTTSHYLLNHVIPMLPKSMRIIIIFFFFFFLIKVFVHFFFSFPF
jgi:hypothetical protein